MNFCLSIFLIIILELSQLACIGQQPSFQNQNISSLEGQVMELLGNAMPSKGKSSYKGRPLLATIYIFQPLHLAQLENQTGAFCNKINGTLIDSVLSNSDGRYHLSLKPGQYSVVVGSENGFFIPYFSGLDGVAYFNIEPYKTTLLNITVNQKANY